MRYFLKLALVLTVLPGYLFVRTSGPLFGNACSSQDAKNRIGDVDGVSESVGICTEVTPEVQKQCFSLIWLPVTNGDWMSLSGIPLSSSPEQQGPTLHIDDGGCGTCGEYSSRGLREMCELHIDDGGCG